MNQGTNQSTNLKSKSSQQAEITPKALARGTRTAPLPAQSGFGAVLEQFWASSALSHTSLLFPTQLCSEPCAALMWWGFSPNQVLKRSPMFHRKWRKAQEGLKVTQPQLARGQQDRGKGSLPSLHPHRALFSFSSSSQNNNPGKRGYFPHLF